MDAGPGSGSRRVHGLFVLVDGGLGQPREQPLPGSAGFDPFHERAAVIGPEGTAHGRLLLGEPGEKAFAAQKSPQIGVWN